MHDALDLRELLGDEVIQRQESGYDLDAVLPQVEKVLQADGPRWSAELEQAYRLLETASVRPDWPYQEPEDETAILAIPPAAATVAPPDDNELADRLHAAWLGRCAGCNLGKPVEGFGWNRARLRSYLEQAGSYPIADYLPVLDPMPEGMTLNPSWRDASRGRISAMARDDDTDYTILGLHMLETYGDRLAPADVGLGMAAPHALRADLHCRARRLPQPHPAVRTAADRPGAQPLPGVDRRDDPGRRVRVRLPG